LVALFSNMPHARRALIAALGVASVLAPLGVAGADRSPATFSLTAAQAQEVSTTIRYLAAFNGRRLRDARALLSSNVAISDCDYTRVHVQEFHGLAAATGWLRRRFADRDRLVLSRIYNENADDPTGSVGLEFARRTNLTLRKLGYASGIVPKGATKVLFTSGSIRIRALSLGPVGGSADLCRPGP